MNDELSTLRAEVALLRRRAELWNAVEGLLHAGTWERDLRTDQGSWSDELLRILGFEGGQTQMSPKVFIDAVHPDDREALSAAHRRALQGAGPTSHRHRSVWPSGEVRWLETSMRLERDAEGRAVKLVGVTTDRTGEQRLAEAIQSRELEYRTIVAEASDGVFVVDEAGRYVEANRAACELLGYSRAELLTKSIADLRVDRSPSRFDAIRAGRQVRVDLHLRRKDGSLVPVDLSAKSLSSGRSFAIVRDMTAREAADRALRESEQTLQELAANVPALFWVRDAKSGKLLYANGGWARLLGQPPAIGEDFRQLLEAIHPEDRQRMIDGSRRAQDGQFDEVVRFVDPKGVSASYRVRAFSIRDGLGEPYRIAGFAENIEDQRIAEQALRDSEARYRSVVLAMSDGIVVHGPKGEIVTANPAALQMLGLTLEQLAGRAPIDPRWRTIREDGSPFPQSEQPGWVTLQTGKPLSGVIMGVCEPGGALRWVSINSRRVFEAGEEGAYSVVASFTDITARRAAEEKVQASLHEKEILLKEIHHRVKNNLQVVSSLLHLQASKIDEPRVAELFKESQNRVLSMSLIHEMLYQSLDLARIPFGTYVQDLASSLGLSWGVLADRVSFVVEAGELMLDVETGVPCGLLLSEILSNCLKHAFPDGRRGTVRITLGLDGDLYRLEVSDDGVGLPGDFEERRRSSLGSKLIDRLVAQLGGTLVRSSSARGTRYEISFPRVAKPTA